MKRQIVGTGPFRLTQAVDGQIYELSRFDNYFGTPAYLDKIQFFPIKGEVERGAALQGKRIDACYFIPSKSVSATLRKIPGMVELRRATPTSINLIPNVQVKPFDDIRVREALSLAIDREVVHQDGRPARRCIVSQPRTDAAGQQLQPQPGGHQEIRRLRHAAGSRRRCRRQPPAGDGACSSRPACPRASRS